MWNLIKRFGPDYCDLPTMVWNINILLRALTLNIDHSYEKPIPLLMYMTAAACATCYYYSYLVSVIWFVFVRCPETGDLSAAMLAASLGISSQISTTKLFYMIARASKVRLLIKQCLEFNALTTSHKRYSRNLLKALRIVKIRAISFWIFIIVIVVLYVHIPIFQKGKHLPNDIYVIYGIEPRFETPYYELSYTMMGISVLYIGYVTSTVSAVIIILVGYIEAQMLSLSEEVLCIWEDSIQTTIEFKIEHLYQRHDKRTKFSSDVTARINAAVKRRLANIMQNHSRYITLLKNLDEFYDLPNGIAFACLGISLIAELLGGLENTYLQVPFTFVQVAMDCYTGQKVIDASLTFERAVYSCKWENFDANNMKIVLLMLQNSQRTMQVTAGGMAVLSFPYLQNIVRMVYSTYTTLRSML